MPSNVELARRIMLRLSVLQSGEVPSHEESQDLITAFQSNHAELMENGYVDWALVDMPLSAEEPWIDYMAMLSADDFGAMTQKILAFGQTGLRRLIATSQQPVDSRDIPVTDY